MIGMHVSAEMHCTVENATSAAELHEEQAEIKHEEEDEDTIEPDPEPKPEEETGGNDGRALDEDSLPSTLFYGVRGQQARPALQCSAVSGLGPPALPCTMRTASEFLHGWRSLPNCLCGHMHDWKALCCFGANWRTAEGVPL